VILPQTSINNANFMSTHYWFEKSHHHVDHQVILW